MWNWRRRTPIPNGAFVSVPQRHALREIGHTVLVIKEACIYDESGSEMRLQAGFLCDGATRFLDVGSAWAWHDYCYAHQLDKTESDELLEDVWEREGAGAVGALAAAALSTAIGESITASAYNWHEGKEIRMMTYNNVLDCWEMNLDDTRYYIDPAHLEKKEIYSGLVGRVPKSPVGLQQPHQPLLSWCQLL
jgi:hypothetical protein